MVPPIASSARNEIAPSAVLATRAGRPAPRALGGEAQRVVFQRLVGNPLIILAPDAVYPLPPCHVLFSPAPAGSPPDGSQDPCQNLRRHFAVQYTRSCVSVQCTISAILAPPIACPRTRNGVLMSDETNKGLKSPLRRKLLMGMAALPAITMLPRPSFADVPATSAVNTTGLAVTDTEVTVGILHSVTGTMAISRDRLGGGREARDRADQRRRRRARPQDQVHPGRRRQRLADLRREGQEAAGQRQVRRRDGLLDLGLAQGGAAGVRAV